MRLGLTVKQETISQIDIDEFKAMKNTLATLKNRYDLLKASIETKEAYLISAIEKGARVDCREDIQIRTIERRYAHYKEILIEKLGTSFLQEVINSTEPTIYKSLLIWERQK